MVSDKDIFNRKYWTAF